MNNRMYDECTLNDGNSIFSCLDNVEGFQVKLL